MEDAIDQCVEGITGNADLKNKVIFSKRNLMFHEGCGTIGRAIQNAGGECDHFEGSCYFGYFEKIRAE
jgi:hypothetical protein